MQQIFQVKGDKNVKNKCPKCKSKKVKHYPNYDNDGEYLCLNCDTQFYLDNNKKIKLVESVIVYIFGPFILLVIVYFALLLTIISYCTKSRGG